MKCSSYLDHTKLFFKPTKYNGRFLIFMAKKYLVVTISKLKKSRSLYYEEDIGKI